VLEEMRRVLKPGGKAVLLVADSSMAGRPLEVEQWLPRLAERARLKVIARAGQRRPHFHRASAEAFGSRPRREHLVVLEAP
jgi:ubiquinone/menaquinone biosynthesis C-methylase UbiE